MKIFFDYFLLSNGLFPITFRYRVAWWSICLLISTADIKDFNNVSYSLHGSIEKNLHASPGWYKWQESRDILIWMESLSCWKKQLGEVTWVKVPRSVITVKSHKGDHATLIYSQTVVSTLLLQKPGDLSNRIWSVLRSRNKKSMR